RDVSGDCYDFGCAPRRNPGDAHFQQRHRHCFWIGADRLRVPVAETSVERRTRDSARPARHQTALEWELSRCRWHSKLQRPACAAGTLSGLLGIGSGAMKVLAMDQAMKIPFKVSTTTSNFMIGVTAAASAGV